MVRKRKIGKNDLNAYLSYLREEKKSSNTIAKYARDVRGFLAFLGDEPEITKELLLQYKESLSANYEAVSVNSMLAALNSFLRWRGLDIWQLKPLKIEVQDTRDRERELTRDEYVLLLKTAQKNGNERLFLVMQTICATGIRVSELQFITVETVQRGQAEVQTKGKVRIAFIPESLQKVLSHYASEQKIETGSVFRSVNGHPLDRSNIWREMKSICEEAGVPSHKVFPHNLRHLFARVFYEEFPALQPMLSGTI